MVKCGEIGRMGRAKLSVKKCLYPIIKAVLVSWQTTIEVTLA